tara:strand:+ start:111 stop:290 length:180 start_codon:yes stop_codon:yes gene_type:complete
MKTNKELASELKTTSRQISKSRKRGYITLNDGTKRKYTAPGAKVTGINYSLYPKKGGKK